MSVCTSLSNFFRMTRIRRLCDRMGELKLFYLNLKRILRAEHASICAIVTPIGIHGLQESVRHGRSIFAFAPAPYRGGPGHIHGHGFQIDVRAERTCAWCWPCTWLRLACRCFCRLEGGARSRNCPLAIRSNFALDGLLDSSPQNSLRASML